MRVGSSVSKLKFCATAHWKLHMGKKEKRLIGFSETAPRGISYQPFNSYLFITNVKLLQMTVLRRLCGSSEVFFFAKWLCPTSQIVLTFAFSESQGEAVLFARALITAAAAEDSPTEGSALHRGVWLRSNRVTHLIKSSAWLAAGEPRKPVVIYKWIRCDVAISAALQS